MGACVVIRYFAAARAAVGFDEEKMQFDGPVSLANILDLAVQTHGDELGKVLPRCSYLLDEVAVHSTSIVVQDGQAVDVLPPFAGG